MRITMLSGEPYFYTRSGNPTVQAVAQQLAVMEGGESALIFSSGMAAITCSLLTLLRSGDHVICHNEIFSQTRTFFDTVLNKFQVTVSYVNFRVPDEISNAFLSNTRLLYVETPSNPHLDIIDLDTVAEFAAKRDVPVVVDSTLGTPALQNPLRHGASLVLHSATKYLAGHSDVLCGAAIGSKHLISKIHVVQKLTGGVIDPHAAYLLHRGLKTLPLRMKQICENAMALSNFLSNRSCIQWIRYPFLDNHPDVSIARRQMKAGGGLISFEITGGLPAARRFVDSLRLIRIATSMGGTDSTIEIPFDLMRVRDENNKSKGLIRLSVGIEDVTLLKNDLEGALASTL